MKSAPSKKACVNPSGRGCSQYSNRTPNCSPVPNNRLKFGKSVGVLMIRMSRIPAYINTEIG